MNNFLKDYVANELISLANKIKSDNSRITEEQALDILSIVSHQMMSTDQACSYLNMSRKKFDTLVAKGKLPKGRKERGFTEHIYYKDELDKYIRK